jgi:hypothetical protein
MPNLYQYTTTVAVTLATRAQAYEELGDMLGHFHNLGINLVSIVRNADNTITVTIDKLIRADHAGFWHLPIDPVVVAQPAVATK